MAHSNVAGSTTSTDKIISSIRLPDGNVYEVHDSSAIHDVSELGLSAALVFKGTKATVANLPSTGNKVGDVWLVTEDSREYVWTKVHISNSYANTVLIDDYNLMYACLSSNSTYTKAQLIGASVETNDGYYGNRTFTISESMVTEETENGLSIRLGEFLYIWVAYTAGYNGLPSVGTYLSDQHRNDSTKVESVTLSDGGWEGLGGIYDAASSTHKHNMENVTAAAQTWTQKSGSATVPSVAVTNGYISASTTGTQKIVSTDSVDVLTSESTFGVTGGTVTNKYISANVDTNVVVEANGTAKAITGFGAHSTASVIQTQTKDTISTVDSNDSVSIPNVTGNTSVTASKVTVTTGTAPSWTASVSNGVLSFGFSAGTTPSTVTATDVSASKVTLGTALSASKVTTSNKSVVTGGTTTSVMNGLGTPTTADALTGVRVKTQPTIKIVGNSTSGDVAVASGIEGLTITPNFKTASVAKAGASVSSPTIKLETSTTNSTNSAAIPTSVSVGTTSVAVTVTGTNSASSVTGTTSTPKD